MILISEHLFLNLNLNLNLCLRPRTPIHLHINIRVEAQLHGTGVAGMLQDLFGLFIQGMQGFRDAEKKMDATNAAWIGLHDLFNIYRHIVQVKAHRSGFDAHHREHAGCKRGGHQVGR